ncbi:substrate-binding periplasmic protein [Janthinobacterium agaricidamnosum]|uniref:Solute-binding protein family 3/N-terminal domain-containing protein n=1 Tax=Janthinobacterium agaricidamnosum NBRC 102515 = DSM 9628 TaxID=1349767 RepID=W0V6T4_9BURK|nr:transporter substrate-binding domain-containing protein [Janthinobacterium agaricidamnosum]CDG82957.1 putative uncharacterized protein [Janthinobacterium agaricidamnosum NBRC 102515 = DSM 9628]
MRITPYRRGNVFPLKLRCLLAALSLAACWPLQAREWQVAGTHFERIYQLDKDGDYTGMGPDIIRQVAAQLGDTVSFKIYPWARAQALVAQGKADILVGPYKSARRQARMAFSERPFYQDQMVLYARADSGFAWNGDYASLAGKRIVVLNGWLYGEAFEHATSSNGARISIANTVENGLKMLMYNHVDVFASNHRNTEPVIAHLGYGARIAPLAGVIEVQNGYFAFPKRPSSDALRLRFDQAFNALADSGELKKLGRRYEVTVP